MNSLAPATLPGGRPQPRAGVVALAVLTGFLNAGAIKGDAALGWLPVDLTVLLAICCSWFVIHALAVNTDLPRVAGWMALQFALWVIPVCWSAWTPYAVRKIGSLFTLTLLASLSPLVLVRSARDLNAFLTAHLCMSGVFVIEALALAVRGASGAEQLTIHSADTINFGRMTAAAGVWLFTISLWSAGMRRILVILLCSASVLISYATGSRGPLLALAVSVALVVSRAGLSPKQLSRMLLLLAGLTGALYWGQALVPQQSSWRIRSFLDGSRRITGREEIFADGIRAALENPLGAGWGASERWNPLGVEGRYYFHNILLEISVEAGALALAVFLGIFILAVVRCWRVSSRWPSPAAVGLLGSVIFYAVCSATSGDINDNRWLLALLGLALNSRQILSKPETELSAARAA